MNLTIKAGNIVDEAVDVLVSTGNIHLNMSGGVNGEILAKGGRSIQAELHQYLKDHNLHFVKPGTVIRVEPGQIPAKHILYTVAIDAWYDSSVELVAQTVTKALAMSSDLGGKTVALPAMATGYGHLKIGDFAKGLSIALQSVFSGIEELRIVLRICEMGFVISLSFFCGHRPGKESGRGRVESWRSG